MRVSGKRAFSALPQTIFHKQRIRIAITVSALAPGTVYHFRLVVVTDTDTINGHYRSFMTLPAGGSDPQGLPSSSGVGGFFIGSVFRSFRLAAIQSA